MADPAVSADAHSDRAREIRATHHYAYRSGEWAALVGVTTHANGRSCYLVRFPDGASDWWPVDDQQAGYEFREAASADVSR